MTKITTDNVTDAFTLDMIQRANKKDEKMQALMNSIRKGYIDNTINLKVYKPIFHELTFINWIVLRENGIIVLSTEVALGQGKLQQLVIVLAHERHQGVENAKNYFAVNPGFHIWLSWLNKDTKLL